MEDPHIFEYLLQLQAMRREPDTYDYVTVRDGFTACGTGVLKCGDVRNFCSEFPDLLLRLVVDPLLSRFYRSKVYEHLQVTNQLDALDDNAWRFLIENKMLKGFRLPARVIHYYDLAVMALECVATSSQFVYPSVFPMEHFLGERFVEAMLQSYPEHFGLMPTFAQTVARAERVIDEYAHYTSDVESIFDSPLFMHNRHLWMFAAKRGWKLYSLPLAASLDREVVFETAKHDGYITLLRCDPRFLSDLDLMKVALESNVQCLKFMHARVSDELLPYALSLNPDAYQYATCEALSDRELAIQVVLEKGSLLKCYQGALDAELMLCAAGSAAPDPDFFATVSKLRRGGERVFRKYLAGKKREYKNLSLVLCRAGRDVGRLIGEFADWTPLFCRIFHRAARRIASIDAHRAHLQQEYLSRLRRKRAFRDL